MRQSFLRKFEGHAVVRARDSGSWDRAGVCLKGGAPSLAIAAASRGMWH